MGVPIRYTREPDTKDYNFKKHDVCSYLVKGDDTMKDVNKIHITVRNIDKAEVWVS